MILDTSFLHDIMHGDEDALDRAIEIENRYTVKLSSVSVYELYYGVGYTDSTDKERQKVDSVIGSKHVLPADTEVMRKAGKVKYHGRSGPWLPCLGSHHTAPGNGI